MPIYEYKCNTCDNEVEVIQKFSDLPLIVCPECKGELRKVISSTSFVLKGGGWYADGYGSSNDSQDSTDSSSSTESKKTESPAKTESKTATTEKKPTTEKKSTAA